MTYLEHKITSDFKTQKSRKEFSCSSLIAYYNKTQSSPEKYKIIIDREDGRRLSMIFTKEEFEAFKSAINRS